MISRVLSHQQEEKVTQLATSAQKLPLLSRMISTLHACVTVTFWTLAMRVMSPPCVESSPLMLMPEMCGPPRWRMLSMRSLRSVGTLFPRRSSPPIWSDSPSPKAIYCCWSRVVDGFVISFPLLLETLSVMKREEIMTRYHVNAEGKHGICRAQNGLCPFVHGDTLRL